MLHEKGNFIKRGIFRLSALVAVMAMSISVQATESTSVNSTKSSASSGVEYVTVNGSTAINLNGNSVIIKASENDTGSGNRLINIYIDKDRDGEIDADEEMAELNGSTDFIGGPAIYGYCNTQGTTPISITTKSGFTPSIYGVYGGSLETENETAVTINIQGGEIQAVYGAYNATVKSTDAGAIKVINEAVSPQVIFGAYTSMIETTGATAIEMIMNNEADLSVQTIMGILGGTLSVSNASVPGIHMSVGNINSQNAYALSGTTYTLTGSAGPAIHLEAGDCSVSELMAVAGGSVTSDGTGATLIDVDVTGQVSNLKGIGGAQIDAGKNTNTALNLDITGAGAITGSVYGICGTTNYSSNTFYPVKGCVNINVAPDATVSGTNLNSFYGVYGFVELDGNVNMDINNARGTSVYGLENNVYVKGNIVFNMPLTNEITSCIYAMKQSSCDGDVTVQVSGAKTNEGSSVTIYGVNEYLSGKNTVVGGNLTFDYLGGHAGNVYAVNLGSNSYKVLGKVDVSIPRGTISSLYGVQNADVAKNISVTVGDYVTDTTEEGNLRENCNVKNSVEPVSSCKAGADVTIRVRNTNSNSSSNFYSQKVIGISSTTVTGKLDVEIDGGYYYQVWGVSNRSGIQGSAELTIKNVNKDWEDLSIGTYSYGFYNSSLAGNLDIITEDSNFYTYYTTNSDTCGGKITSTMTKCKAYNWLTGPYTGANGGGISSTMTDVSAGTIYGAYLSSGNCGGSVSVNMTRAAATSQLNGFYGSGNSMIAEDVTVTMTNCSSGGQTYGFCGADIYGNLELEISGGTYGSSTGYDSQCLVSAFVVKGTSTVNVSGASFYGNVQVYAASNDSTDVTNGSASVTVEKCKFEKNNYSSFSITVSAATDQEVDAVVNAETTIADTGKISAGSSGNGIVTVAHGDDAYYGGNIVFDEDTNKGEIHFTGGSIHIKEGVTLTADMFYFEGGNIFLEGTLNAPLAGEKNGDGKYTYSTIYMAGGSLAQASVDVINQLYYPFEMNYKDKGGSVTPYNIYMVQPVVHSYGGDQLFAKAGQEYKYCAEAYEGYTLTSVTYQGADDAAPINIPYDETYACYIFTMPQKACSFDVDFKGNQIVAGKTIADPVAKLNVATTAAAPLYDLATLSISNDGSKGSVSYMLSPVDGLPEGLSLVDGKIYGTPTVAYENGKKTIIRVTGKNDTYVDVPLNIVVTAGEGKQESQEGRITVDDTDKIVYFSGNSVVIETQDNQTAIYLDENRDGTADYETPAYVGDLTEYTVYGTRNTDSATMIRITMNGGTIGTIYGAYNGAISAKGHGLVIHVNGGSVGALYGLTDASVADTMEFVVGKEATVTTFKGASNSVCYDGFYYNSKGMAQYYGTYSLKEDLTTDSLYLDGACTLTIEKGVTVNVTSVSRSSGSVIKLKGTLNAESCTGTGHLIMQGGSVPADSAWGYVYYPITSSTNVKGTSVTYALNANSTTHDSQIYLRAGGDIQTHISIPSGYEYYYSLDGGEVTKVSAASFVFSMPRKAAKIDITYVPTQISVEKLFADPTGKVGVEYTEAAPLYDLSGLVISNDTTVSYGGEVKYALKATSSLPKGLSFVDGKVIGTPTEVSTSGTKVTFVVTGRNGTTEDVEVLFKIRDENYEIPDINDVVTVGSSSIELNGTSVVIFADPSSSSKSMIYLDADHDKIADNNSPLLIKGATSTNLASWSLYGYTNTSKAYEGDISITIKGGNLGYIYGVKGTSLSSKAVVNGDVSLDIENVIISGKTAVVYGAYYAEVNDLTYAISGGSYTYCDLYGARETKVDGNLHFAIGGTAKMTASSGTNYYTNIYVADVATVTGDVYMTLGASTSSSAYGCIANSTSYSYTYFYGVHDSTVNGNVNQKINGYWYGGKYHYVANASDIAKDINIELERGVWQAKSAYPYVAGEDTTVSGDVNINVAENSSFGMNGPNVLESSTAKNIYVNIPDSCIGSMSSIAYTDLVENCVYIYNKGTVSIGGKYTITEDLTSKGIQILANADVTIAEGVTVDMTAGSLVVNTGATLTNNGTLKVYKKINATSEVLGTIINNGRFENTSASKSYYLTIASTGMVINSESGVWEVAGRVSNSGNIINHGEFTQTYTDSYYGYLGNVYSTVPLTLSKDPSLTYIYTENSNLYFPVTMEYPQQCVDEVVLSGTVSSPDTTDTLAYVECYSSYDDSSKTKLTVTPGTTLMDTVELASVTYGPDNTALDSNSDGTWSGAITGVFEPITIRLNYEAKDTVEKITLGQSEASIRNEEGNQVLAVGKTYTYAQPLYDLSTIQISNDIADGTVTYSLDPTAEGAQDSLPVGIYLKNGRLYGSFNYATEDNQKFVFAIKGKNQTTAFFTLTLGPVAKQVPSWSVPTGFQALVGETLADVNLPYTAQGTYSWPDGTISVGDTITTLEDQTLLFTPANTANYDWAAAAVNAGATYENGVITCKVDIQVCAGVPDYTEPGTLTATYGDTYGDVTIPAGDNAGTFEWIYSPSASVGNVGTYVRRVNYIPNDSNYQKVTNISVTLVVEPAVPTYTRIGSVSQICGSTLADIILPDAEGGKYQWITTSTTIPLDGKSYQVGFKPSDTVNYDWTQIEGWNDAWKCVVFPITVYLEHTYATEYEYDDTYHWYPCLDETCDSVEGKETHLWDAGTVIESATMEEEGLIEYSCECGASYEASIPKLTHPSHVYTGAWKYDADEHWKQCTYSGCVETTEPADHTFDKGVAVTAPTATQKGTVKYTCTVCKYTKTQYLTASEWVSQGWGPDPSASGNTGSQTGGSQSGGTQSGREDEKDTLPKVGTKFTDKKSKASYKITVAGKEVAFVKPSKKTYTKVSVPKTVKYEGVTYKVTSIANNACKSNKKLKTVTIGANVKTIGTKAFYGCTKLTKVTIGSKVTTIGNSAFQSCTALKSITIPSKVSQIGKKAFYGCKKLVTMKIKTSKLTDKKVGKDAFKKMGSSNYKKVKVTVPKKKLSAYKKMLKKKGLSSKAKVKK